MTDVERTWLNRTVHTVGSWVEGFSESADRTQVQPRLLESVAELSNLQQAFLVVRSPFVDGIRALETTALDDRGKKRELRVIFDRDEGYPDSTEDLGSRSFTATRAITALTFSGLSAVEAKTSTFLFGDLGDFECVQ